jgi:hypothetical protein
LTAAISPDENVEAVTAFEAPSEALAAVEVGTAAKAGAVGGDLPASL